MSIDHGEPALDRQEVGAPGLLPLEERRIDRAGRDRVHAIPRAPLAVAVHVLRDAYASAVRRGSVLKADADGAHRNHQLSSAPWHENK